MIGGGRGIRTPGRLAPTQPFQGCTIDHSDIPPIEKCAYYTILNRTFQGKMKGFIIPKVAVVWRGVVLRLNAFFAIISRMIFRNRFVIFINQKKGEK